MRYLLITLVLLVSIVNAKIVIVVSEQCEFDKISTENIKYIFMGMKSSLLGQKIVAVDSSDRNLYEKFSKKYLNKNLTKMKIYWTRMVFSGKRKLNKKVHLDNLDSLKEKCSITYLREKDIPKFLKRVETFDK